MKEMLKLGALLMLICAVAAAALAGIYSVTQPRIVAQEKAALQEALSSVLPGAAVDAVFPVEKDGKVLYYEGYRDGSKSELIGYALPGERAGYSSTVKVLVGVDLTGKILGLRVLDEKETPGLGTRIEEVRYGESDPWFQRQFAGKTAASLAVDKDGGDIQAITGATISSRAVVNAVVSAFKTMREQKNSN